MIIQSLTAKLKNFEKDIKVDHDFLTFISFQEKLLFTKHLSIMLKSGMPILEAMDTLQEQTRNKSFRKILLNVISEVSNGKSLSLALTRHKKIFGDLYISIIKIGEESGNLEENLMKLAESMEKFYSFRQKVIGASIYPAIILLTGVTIIVFISIFVFPKVIELFATFEGKLPITTRILLNIIKFTEKYGIYVFVGFIGTIVVTTFLLRYRRFKFIFDTFLINLPIFGGFIRNVVLANIFLNLGIMLKSGVPISKTFEYQLQGVTNLVYKDMLMRLDDSLTSGKNLSSELNSNKYRYMPIIARRMIIVGEKSGTLPDTFSYLGNFFEEEVDYFTKSLGSIIEPILLLTMGLIVGFFAIAIITPIYQLSGGSVQGL